MWAGQGDRQVDRLDPGGLPASRGSYDTLHAPKLEIARGG